MPKEEKKKEPEPKMFVFDQVYSCLVYRATPGKRFFYDVKLEMRPDHQNGIWEDITDKNMRERLTGVLALEAIGSPVDDFKWVDDIETILQKG